MESMHVVVTLDKLKKSLKSGDASVGFNLSNEAVMWSQTVRDSADSQELVKVLESIKVKVSASLDQTGLLLDKVFYALLIVQEQHECEGMRTKYVGKWTQGHSASMTQNMRIDLGKHREVYSRGIHSDNELISRFGSSKRVIDILRQPLENVEAIFAAEVSGNGAASPSLIDSDISGGFNDIGEQVQVDKLESLVQRIKLLKKERGDVVQDLKAKVWNVFTW